MQVVAPLLQVLVRLHVDRIVHRDIKPENLFLTRKRQLKLGDLGLAIVAAEELPFTRSGTLDYMAPEVGSAACQQLVLVKVAAPCA
jgi:serine/threonine protein kinase